MGVYSWNMVALWYGTKWRRGRRLFHEFFNMKAVTNFDDYQRKHTYRLLSLLSQTPEDFLAHAQLYGFPRIRPLYHQADFHFFKRDRRVDHGYNVRFEHRVSRRQVLAGGRTRDAARSEGQDSRCISH